MEYVYGRPAQPIDLTSGGEPLFKTYADSDAELV
jgi:hypothetical protein